MPPDIFYTWSVLLAINDFRMRFVSLFDNVADGIFAHFINFFLISASVALSSTKKLKAMFAQSSYIDVSAYLLHIFHSSMRSLFVLLRQYKIILHRAFCQTRNTWPILLPYSPCKFLQPSSLRTPCNSHRSGVCICCIRTEQESLLSTCTV